MTKKRKCQRKTKNENQIRKLNMNTIIKVKLTEKGIDIYFHQYDHLIDKGLELVRMYPNVDADGFTSFQLWTFMSLYGPYIGLGLPNVIDDIYLYIPDNEMEYVKDDK